MAAPAEEGDIIHAPPGIVWEKIAELPPRHGDAKNPGLAGVFAGAQGDCFLIAGGTSYPDGAPWTGAKRAVSRDIYVLQRTAGANGPAFSWQNTGDVLPEALSYGASVSLPDGVLCIGGSTLTETRAACFLMTWDPAARKVAFTPFPALPRPLAFHAAVLLKNVVYVMGGSGQAAGSPATASFYALDLAKRGAATGFEWQALTPWDGAGRIFPVAAASLEGTTESIYLCGGRDPGNTRIFSSIFTNSIRSKRNGACSGMWWTATATPAMSWRPPPSMSRPTISSSSEAWMKTLSVFSNAMPATSANRVTPSVRAGKNTKPKSWKTSRATRAACWATMPRSVSGTIWGIFRAKSR